MTNNLADRCEAASGADRELDWRIAEQVDGNWPETSNWPPFVPGSKMEKAIPHYTASIDAALTLVPEGWAWTAARYWCEGEDAPPYYADCTDLAALIAGEDAAVFEAKAATPALALCAAALRAKESRNVK